MDFYRTEDRQRYFNVKNSLFEDNLSDFNDIPLESMYDVRNLSQDVSDSDSYDENIIAPINDSEVISSNSAKETRC